VSKKRKIDDVQGGGVAPETRSSLENDVTIGSLSSANSMAILSSQIDTASRNNIDEKESAMDVVLPNTQETSSSTAAERTDYSTSQSSLPYLESRSSVNTVTAEQSLPTPPSSQISIKEVRFQKLSTCTRADQSQRAEKLRFGLRLARYKVETNQIHIPFHDLNLAIPFRQDIKKNKDGSRMLLSSPPLLESPCTTTSHPRGLLSAPGLVPTAYLTCPAGNDFIPSSPPDSAGPARREEDRGEEHQFATPLAPRTKAPAQLSSPPDSQSRGAEKLTSSVVKGRAAASGLLELMHTG
jgi:hypothetical protein